MMKRLAFILYFSLLMIPIFAQNQTKIDSLLKLLSYEKYDTQKVHFLNQIAFLYRSGQPQKMTLYADSALQLATNIQFRSGIAESYLHQGISLMNQGKLPQSKQRLEKAWNTLPQAQQSSILGVHVLNRLGMASFRQKILSQAMQYYIQSLKLSEKLGYQAGIANNLTSMGNIYNDQENYAEAIKLHQQAIAINEKINDQYETYRCMSNLGYTYNHIGQLENALIMYQKGLKIAQQMNAPEAITDLLDEIGVVYMKQGKYKEAQEYLEKAIKINTEINNVLRIVQNQMNIAQCLFLQNKLIEAEKYAWKAYKGNKEGGFKILKAHEFLLNVLKKQGKQAEAYPYLEEYVLLKDSILGLQKTKDIEVLRSNYGIEKKQDEIELLKQQQMNQKLQTLAFGLGLVSVLVIVFILYRNNRKEKGINALLAQQQEELISGNEALETTFKQLRTTSDRLNKSIQYSYNIQQVILPQKNELNDFFQAHFSIYLPKDVVSGDFYWFTKLDDNSAIFVLADCTGHGVSGAFMSMIGATLLHETIKIKGIKEPARILRNLHAGIRNILKQEEGQNRDGMDISICLCEKNTETSDCQITFAGAKSNIFYRKDGEIYQLSGDRISIGGFTTREREFTNQQVALKANDFIYLTSDGYIDQNNAERRSFGSVRFKELLNNICQLPIDEQEQAIISSLKKHQQKEEQRDDISVIGIQP